MQILDKARRSTSPTSPNHKQDILTGIIVSLILSALIVFLIEFMDNSIRTISHIENLNLTVLGVSLQLVALKKTKTFIICTFKK